MFLSILIFLLTTNHVSARVLSSQLGWVHTFPQKQGQQYQQLSRSQSNTSRRYYVPVHSKNGSQNGFQQNHNLNYTFRNGRLLRSSSLNLFPLSMNLPIISPNDTWGNIATLSVTASLSQKLGKTTKIGKLLGPPVTAMAIAFILGSIGVLPPGGSSGAKLLQMLSIQMATPLLLLSADLRDCRKRCGPLFSAFMLASLSTLIACVVAMKVCNTLLMNALGNDGLKIGAALLAKNVGGGVNYIAVCRSLNASVEAVAAGLCVDNLFALVYFPVTSALSAGRPDLEDSRSLSMNDSTNDGDGINKSNLNTETISVALTFAAIITWLGEKIGGSSASLPIATLITILFTSIFPKRARWLREAGETLGTTFLYLFFATAGAPGISIADSVKSSFLPISLYLSFLYVIHGLILVLTRKIFLFVRKNSAEDVGALQPQRLLVASSAAIGGPATAAALAQANGWNSLIGPSLLVGNLGYAIATFIGLAFYKILKPI